MKRKMAALMMILCLAASAAVAETISFSGTVEASETVEVYSPIGGIAEVVPVKAGDSVTADSVIARIKTTKVYAPEDGTVTSVFGQPGDDAETVATDYGAVLYLEGETVFTVTGSSSKAYDAKDNYLVHSGETLYLTSRNHTKDKGVGTVTAVTESDYTIRVTSGDFYVGDKVYIFRTENNTNASRIGQGTIARVAPIAVSGTGTIVSYAVQPGDQVKRGQLLFETVTGGYDNLKATGTEIKAGVDGVISTLNVEQGAAVTEDTVIAVIYPKNAVRVSANVAEGDLKDLQIGQKVKVELDWNQDQGVSYEGTVEMISQLGTVGEESTTFPVYVSFVPDENTRFSMTALVSTPEGENEDSMEADEAEEEETPVDQAAGRPEAGEGDRPEKPAGRGD